MQLRVHLYVTALVGVGIDWTIQAVTLDVTSITKHFQFTFDDPHCIGNGFFSIFLGIGSLAVKLEPFPTVLWTVMVPP